MLVGGADVRLEVQAVGFVELARQAVSREQAHGFYTATYRVCTQNRSQENSFISVI